MRALHKIGLSDSRGAAFSALAGHLGHRGGPQTRNRARKAARVTEISAKHWVSPQKARWRALDKIGFSDSRGAAFSALAGLQGHRGGLQTRNRAQKAAGVTEIFSNQERAVQLSIEKIEHPKYVCDSDKLSWGCF